MDAFQRFLKAELAKQKEVSTGSVLLDRAFMVPIGSTLLIKGSASVGTTAVGLYLGAQLSKLQDKIVIYFDIFNSGSMSHRLQIFNSAEVLIFKPWQLDPNDILEALEEISKIFPDAVLIFDNIFFYEKLWKHWTFTQFIRSIKLLNNNFTIIATQRKQPCSDIWSSVVSLEQAQNIYTTDDEGDSMLAGHLVKVHGPIGSSVIYIDHLTGRVSEAFEHVRLGIESKEKTANSVFSFDGIRAQGAWNLVHQSGKKIRNELQID